ncbi:hypothetical protein ACRE_037390 [Hapsidospora chrysogenum ATCC 11550]|uniref:Uncharacterized protein n=1 Tax=Hapsidospora chrysogenum (strain ATCC 11550 / CBS 779.69 / DSM 880 / IAM 14645 / JCM 23072 / IMI 49137) TaxID=857340 RepID=A0A086T7R9_HAPC1|nr:hypothetical protein ACRE_037390 [Hapsidospora chrysogenum ATCC 11550]
MRTKENEMQPSRQPEVSKPTGGPAMVPPRYREATERPIEHSSYDLDRKTIFKALDNMQKGVTVHAVAVGGAVKALYLESRKSTHDVDFFLGNPGADKHRAIHEAARYANRQTNGALGGDWFNNATQLFPRSGRLNIVIFEGLSSSGGLKVYAAPWSYAFCGKLNSLCKES